MTSPISTEWIDRTRPALRTATLGCRVNQYETQLVREALERAGYRSAEAGESASLCVVNTCTVTSNSDQDSRQIIRRLARDNPTARTIVMGCYATRDPEAVAQLPNVVEVVTDKRELPDVLQRFGVADFPEGITRFPGRQRAFVKIQDGCILNCSYCIIPYVRPGLRTRPAEHIVDEVHRLVDAGHREIVLTGIHIGHYGVESTRGKSGLPPFRLWHLLERLDRIPGDWRMRLSSIESAEMNDDFIRAVAQCERLCPHFHPALQSGSGTVLRRMRRRYSARRFLDTLAALRSQLDEPTFSTDVIAGFPGETDDEFAETLAVCREAKFVRIHAFPFSARAGTPAASATDRVPEPVIQQRIAELARLERELQTDYYRMQIERRGAVEVIVEGALDSASPWAYGTDRRYVPVLLAGTVADAGRLVRGVASDVRDGRLLAERDGVAVTV